MADVTEVFVKGAQNRLHLLVDFLILVGESGRVGWWKRWHGTSRQWCSVNNRQDLDCGCAFAARVCGYVYSAGDVSWVVDGNLYFATGKVFKMAEKCLLEWAPEEEVELCVLDDVGMDIEGHVTNLHGQGFCTSYHPVGGAICSFHLYCPLCVYGYPKGVNKVSLDDDDLQAGVEDHSDLDVIIDSYIKLL